MRVIGSIVLVFTMAFGALAEDPNIGNSHYLVLATNRTSTMQKEIDIAAKAGFRVTAGMHGGEAIIFMERIKEPAERYEYRLLATHRASTMEKELNEAGRDGYRFVPQTAFENGDEGIVITEREINSGKRYEYRLLATHRTSTLERELNEAGKDGFVLKGSFNRDEKMAVVERVFSSQ